MSSFCKCAERGPPSEGQVVPLQPVEAAGVDDGFDDEERKAPYQAVDEGIAAARAGDHADAEAFTRDPSPC